MVLNAHLFHIINLELMVASERAIQFSFDTIKNQIVGKVADWDLNLLSV